MCKRESDESAAVRLRQGAWSAHCDRQVTVLCVRARAERERLHARHREDGSVRANASAPTPPVHNTHGSRDGTKTGGSGAVQFSTTD